MTESPIAVLPIADADVDSVAQFLHDELNPAVSCGQWAVAMQRRWESDATNCGFQLVAGGRVVGAGLAFYSVREIRGRQEKFCNLGALCVSAGARAHSVRLLRALLAQRGYHFTDFSPSGNVVGLNQRLGFVALDTRTSLVVNRPHLTPRGRDVFDDPDEIADHLDEATARTVQDHRASSAVKHLLVSDDRGHCWVVVRRDRRKGLPVFASIVHVSDQVQFERLSGTVYHYVLTRMRRPFTLVDRHVLPVRPRHAIDLGSIRTKMIKSKGIAPQDVDYLYSELTEISW